MVAVLVVLIASLCWSATAQPPAPGSGGAPCKINAHCGIPAANCPYLREQCVSLTGSCVNGFCACATNWFCCGNCDGQAVMNATPPYNWTSFLPMLDGSRRYVDICSVPRGGAQCTQDTQCGTQGGLCLAGQCVCPPGWICGNCTMTQTDLLYGLRCGIPDGGAPCVADKDCNNGRCVITAGGSPPPFCQCNPLAGCADCSRNTTDLAQNKTTCPPLY